MNRDTPPRPSSGGPALALLGVLALASCSASAPPSSTRGAPASSAAQSGTAGESSTVSAASSGAAGTPLIVGTRPNSAGSGGSAGGAAAAIDASCVKTRQEAERVPVDMYIMLDRSGSMLATTGAGPTKWDATRNALESFINDPRSDGLGVGLQYFPVGKPGVPTSCLSDDACGSNGPCVNRICRPPRIGPSIPVTFCLQDSECPLLSPGCAPAGTCASDDSLVCFALGANGCSNGDACQPLKGECFGYGSCDASVYAQPQVPIASLPGAATALTDSLHAAMPLGLTPTYAALSGALEQVRQRAKSEPSQRVVAVLATDGLPGGCDMDTPVNVQTLARQGLAGSPSVSTYVIGVFGPDEAEASQNLNAWASAGGTGTAFIVDPTQNLSAQFLEALEKIRSGAIACEYRIPPSPAGSALDLNMVNVALVETTRTRDFRYVTDASRCDLTPLGWYYDVNPSAGNPTKIVVCPQACDTLKATQGGRVEVRLGCLTMGPD